MHLRITDKGIAYLSRFKKLRSLNFIGCNLSPATIKYLSEQLSHLISLNMTWCSISDPCVEHLPLFATLKHLSLQDSRITDSGLAKLEHLRQLSSLNLSFCNQITDRGVMHAVKYLKSILFLIFHVFLLSLIIIIYRVFELVLVFRNYRSKSTTYRNSFGAIEVFVSNRVPQN